MICSHVTLLLLLLSVHQIDQDIKCELFAMQCCNLLHSTHLTSTLTFCLNYFIIEIVLHLLALRVCVVILCPSQFFLFCSVLLHLHDLCINHFVFIHYFLHLLMQTFLYLFILLFVSHYIETFCIIYFLIYLTLILFEFPYSLPFFFHTTLNSFSYFFILSLISHSSYTLLNSFPCLYRRIVGDSDVL
jgi:hypothetical protein